MRSTEKFSLVLKLGHQNSRTVDGLSELSYPGWTEGFDLLTFCSFTFSTKCKTHIPGGERESETHERS